jgi:hypothetical protein
MANFDDCTIHMGQIAAELQKAADDHTRDYLSELSQQEKNTYIFANHIRDLLLNFKGLEKHFETSKDPLNLDAYAEDLKEIQRLGQILAEDKLSPITEDQLPLTGKLELDKITADDLCKLQDKLSILAEELQNVARRTTNKMSDKTAWHYQASLINCEAAKERRGLGETAVRNQKTN